MRVLLDTHTCLWTPQGDSLLSATAYLIINDVEDEALLSIASLWEMAIKVRKGTLIVSAGGQPFAQGSCRISKPPGLAFSTLPPVTRSRYPRCHLAAIKTLSIDSLRYRRG